MLSSWFLKAAAALISVIGMVAAIFYQGKRSQRLNTVKNKLKEKEAIIKYRRETQRAERKMFKTPGSKSLSAALNRLRNPKNRT